MSASAPAPVRTTRNKTGISWWLLFGDFVPFLGLFVFAFATCRNGMRLLGSAIAIPSFALWLLAKLQLGNSFTFAACAQQLVTNGLYSKFRHPIYVFSTLALLGTALCLGNRYFYAYLVVTIVAQLWRSRREEKVLQDNFGEAYEGYKRGTWF